MKNDAFTHLINAHQFNAHQFNYHQPRKRFGQNFLHDQSIIAQIVDAIYPQKDDLLVEIGPGMGALTEPMLSQVDNMTVIELDKDLASSLRLRIGAHSHGNFTIVQDNAMTVDYRLLHQNLTQSKRATKSASKPANKTFVVSASDKLRIVGNLPYNISTPILFHLLNFTDIIQDMHFMLQKEVVDRITADVGTKAYGRLSVMMQYHCEPQYLLTVPNGAFNPPPKVTSAVFRLTPYVKKPVTANDEARFAMVVRECFNHRRKTLRAIFKKNALLPTLPTTAFDDIGVDEMARPETLTVADFVALSHVLHDSDQ